MRVFKNRTSAGISIPIVGAFTATEDNIGIFFSGGEGGEGREGGEVVFESIIQLHIILFLIFIPQMTCIDKIVGQVRQRLRNCIRITDYLKSLPFLWYILPYPCTAV